MCYDEAVFPEPCMDLLRPALGLRLASSGAVAHEIPATEAVKHVGENATVCGRIASEHTATSRKGTPTFINLDRPQPESGLHSAHLGR